MEGAGTAQGGVADEWRQGGYFISLDRARLDLEVIHNFLSRSYWAGSRPKEVTRVAIQNSLAFGLYHSEDSEQVGFARVVTDYATFAYLADVFVLEAHRGRGLGKFLVATVLAYPPLELCGWTLFTQDAHGLYRHYGFETPDTPERLMRRKPVGPGGVG